MAKTAKLKKKPPTPHSRAARRASSPSLELDPSIRNAPRADSPPENPKSITKPHILSSTSKIVKKKSKPMKRQQRLRQTKAMEKAADAMDKMEVKVAKSVKAEKKVRERRKVWEDVNGDKRRNPYEVFEEQRKDREWVSDEDMDGGELAEEMTSGYINEVVVPETIPLPVANGVEEDELL